MYVSKMRMTESQNSNYHLRHMQVRGALDPIGRILLESEIEPFQMVRVHTHLANRVATMGRILAPKWHANRVVVRSMNEVVMGQAVVARL